MARISEQISKANTSSQGKTDSNLANDSLNLGGIAAEDYATKKYVQEYHDNKEKKLREDMIDSDAATLEKAKEYTNSQIRNQDFSDFAKLIDVQAVDKKLSEEITEGLNEQKNYTDEKAQAIVDDVNANFSEVEGAIGTLNGTVEELFTSVSNGKSEIAEAITDKGVPTSADDSFSTMASNISQIQSGGGGGGEVVVPPGYYDTSDATATPFDLLQGKSAYSSNGKIDGLLKIDESTGEPSYDIGAVEKVYSSDANTLNLEKLPVSFNTFLNSFTYYTDPAGKYYYWYKLEVYSKTLEITNLDTNEKKQFNVIDDLKVKCFTQGSVSETTTEGVTISDINITKSGENSYLAILAYLKGDAATSPEYEAEYTLILVPFSSNANHIDQFTFDTDNNKYYNLNYLSNRTRIITDLNRRLKKPITISEDKTKLAISLRYSKSSATIMLFNVSSATLEVNKVSEINISNAYDIQSMLIYSSVNKKIILGQNCIFLEKNNGTIVQYNLSSKESNTKMSSISATEDGTHYVEMCQIGTVTYLSYGNLSINYETGTIQQTKIGRVELPTLSYPVGTNTQSNNRIYFMGNSKILLLQYSTQNYLTINMAYKVDFESETVFEPILETDTSILYFSQITVYAGTNCLLFGNYGRLMMKSDYTNVIALKYNGEYYYKRTSGNLSATTGDVKSGKTFVGYSGEIETGTLEV